MKFHRSFIPFAIGILACAFAGGTVRATTIMRMTLVQMAQASHDIVRARCLTNHALWENGELWTLTTFNVEETWRGSASGQIAVRLLGGKTSQLTSIVSGVPHFRPGEEVVLFLQPTAQGDYSVVSWQEGTFRIRRDAGTGEERVTQDTAGIKTYDVSARLFVTSGICRLPMADFRAQVEAALLNRRAR